MRRGLGYLDLAEKCRRLASRLTEPRYKKQLEGMAQLWETATADRAKQLAKAARVRGAAQIKSEVMSDLPRKRRSPINAIRCEAPSPDSRTAAKSSSPTPF